MDGVDLRHLRRSEAGEYRQEDGKLLGSSGMAYGSQELHLSTGQISWIEGDDEFVKGAPLLRDRKYFIKLEVIGSRQIDYSMRWRQIASLAASFFLLLLLILGCTVYAYPTKIDINEEFQTLYFTVYPLWIDIGCAVIRVLAFVLAVAISVVFGFQLFRNRSNGKVLPEQKWILLLAVCTVFYINISDVIISLRISGTGINDDLFNETWYIVMQSIRQTAFAGVTVFYLLASAHTFRILDDKITKWFYVPKLAAVVFYVVAQQVMFWVYHVRTLDLPLLTWIPMLRIYTQVGWSTTGAICILTITAIELILAGMIVRSMRKTRLVLRDVDYLQFRPKQIGFRFFAYHNLMFYITSWTLGALYFAFIPNGVDVAIFVASSGVGAPATWVYVSSVFMAALAILLVAYVSTEAYFKLPVKECPHAEIHDQRAPSQGWLSPGYSSASPMTYRRTEPDRFDSRSLGEVSASCFIMDTHVVAFNFAWLAYYYGTEKYHRLAETQAMSNLKVHSFIQDTEADTHCLVVDMCDRIVVSFRGTSSFRNLRTDASILMRKLNSFLPTRAGRACSLAAESYSDIPGFTESKVHRGFAAAHVRVASKVLESIQELYQRKRRVVLFTGHSLGGSLSTLAALDCSMSLGIGPDEIVVSTFGSPRVGNKAFRNVYSARVTMHWSVELAPNIVPRLPLVTYKTVGNRVLLTSDGTMFLDPNTLESGLFRRVPMSMFYHRKSSYLLALRAWCENHHRGLYKPDFWPWPISDECTKRFRSTNSVSTTPRAIWDSAVEEFSALSSLKSRQPLAEAAKERW
eukprot:CAMPEP_0184754330 /NCGR_PEP_ID=MMETSP0315-20130426/44565_1 /TAXON_ID=101924 /ORGANISM="Rhodosorus marinus, Strain UTEX LB 2760" /LENGTH=800 /DNA_ID=CAMNT_0027233747 /DNA_START=206 /DNA_END=2605 /DNA_ORIENTATION=+